jgi:hypothetical protein
MFAEITRQQQDEVIDLVRNFYSVFERSGSRFA